MNKFSVTIKNLQHITKLEFEIDLNTSGLIVIVGKNGVGKTLLFKAIQNLITSNTFANTSNHYIYGKNSQISYKIDDKDYMFNYNDKIKTLDYKGEVDKNIIQNIYVELPIPFGNRFNQFQKLTQIDKDIRRNIIVKNYETPTDLIELLNYIYDTTRFDNLKEFNYKNENYYFILLESDYYIREDYLSSGEYFVLNIYKLIQKKCKFIAIDEIDISLDSMAQVRFIKKLRELSIKHNIKLLFSTHSLALIKTLENSELFYMDLQNGICSFENKSYNYIKSLLYGFKGYDKYILTEDKILKEYMEYLLKNENIFTKYIIVYIGGDGQVIELMDNNKEKEIFDNEKNVISVLDGDKSHHKSYKKRNDIYFLPFQSIEKDFYEFYKHGKFGVFTKEELKKYNLQNENSKEIHKSIYKMFIRNKLKTQNEIFYFLSNEKINEVNNFKNQLINFLIYV